MKSTRRDAGWARFGAPARDETGKAAARPSHAALGRRAFVGLAALVLLLSTSAARADAPLSATEILRRAANANLHVAYRGVRRTTTWVGRGSESWESVEYADGHERYRFEYRAPRSAKGRTVIDDGDWHWQIEPHPGRVFRSRSDPMESDRYWDLPLLARNYTITLSPHLSQVAKRETYRLVLAPRHPGKPQRIIWVDTKTFLMLRREALHADGSPERWTVFTEIDYRPRLDASLFRYDPHGQSVTTTQEPAACPSADVAAKFVGRSVPFLRCLPTTGFDVRHAFCAGKGDERAVHFIYVDGINTLSLFVDRQVGRAAMKGARPIRIGSRDILLKQDHHFGVLRWTRDGLRYNLVGDLSRDALLDAAKDVMAGR